MTADHLTLRKIVVLLSAVIYWGVVVINVYRIRKYTGKSPNLIKPKQFKDILLLSGWFFIVAGWMGQPLVVERYSDTALFSFMSFFSHPFGILIGIFMVLFGYLGTLWCYATLGNSWRLGINKNIKTVLVKQGIYRFVRHPIYLFQIIILCGVLFLLPTPFSLLISLTHFICILVMALDEEAYLLNAHGDKYKDYFSRTGRFLPKWGRQG